MYTKKIISIFIGIIFLLTSGIISAEKPSDVDALRDVNEGKVVWDVTVGSPSKLLKLLKVMEETYDDLVRQGAKPDMILAFRGPAVKLISTQPLNLPLDEEEAHEEVIEQLREFSQKPNVNLESCSVTTRLLGIDNDTIMSEVKPVGNTFVSLIGYQKKGYALIPIY